MYQHGDLIGVIPFGDHFDSALFEPIVNEEFETRSRPFKPIAFIAKNFAYGSQIKRIGCQTVEGVCGKRHDLAGKNQAYRVLQHKFQTRVVNLENFRHGMARPGVRA